MKAKVVFELPIESKNNLVKLVVSGRIDSDNDYEFDLTAVQMNIGISNVLSLTSYYNNNVTARMELEREIEDTFNLEKEFSVAIESEKEVAAQS